MDTFSKEKMLNTSEMLSRIEKEIDIVKDRMTFHNEEMIKTDKMIDECKLYYEQQKKEYDGYTKEMSKLSEKYNALFTLKNNELKEANALMFSMNERQTFKRVKTNNFFNPDETDSDNMDCRIVKRGRMDDFTSGEQRVAHTSEIFVKIDELEGPEDGYKSIRDVAANKSFRSITYRNQTLIPNVLKLILDARKMIVVRLPTAGIYSIEELIDEGLSTTMYIHMAKGNGKLIYQRYGRSGTVDMSPDRSYVVPGNETPDTKFIIITNGLSIIAFDVLDRECDDDDGEDDGGGGGMQERYPYTPPDEVKHHPYSFLRAPMSDMEIRGRMVFVSIKSALDDEDRPVPINVAVVAYDDQVLMDEILCPRQHVRSYEAARWKKEVRDEDLMGRNDGRAVMRRFRQLIQGRVVVIQDIRRRQYQTSIDLATLAGLRQIQSCIALTKVAKVKDDEYRLCEIALGLGLPAANKFYSSALIEARQIRMIYLRLESMWDDTRHGVMEMLRYNDSDNEGEGSSEGAVGVVGVDRQRGGRTTGLSRLMLAHNNRIRREETSSRDYDEGLRRRRSSYEYRDVDRGDQPYYHHQRQ